MHWRFLWLGSCPDKLTNLPNVHLLASWTRCFSRVSRLAHPTNAWPGDNRSWPHRLCKGRQSSCSYLVRAGGGPQVLAWNRMVEPKSFCDGSAISSPMVCTADFIVKSEGMCHSGAVLHLCRTYHSPTRRGWGVLPSHHWFIMVLAIILWASMVVVGIFSQHFASSFFQPFPGCQSSARPLQRSPLWGRSPGPNWTGLEMI